MCSFLSPCRLSRCSLDYFVMTTLVDGVTTFIEDKRLPSALSRIVKWEIYSKCQQLLMYRQVRKRWNVGMCVLSMGIHINRSIWYHRMCKNRRGEWLLILLSPYIISCENQTNLLHFCQYSVLPFLGSMIAFWYGFNVSNVDFKKKSLYILKICCVFANFQLYYKSLEFVLHVLRVELGQFWRIKDPSFQFFWVLGSLNILENMKRRTHLEI